LIRCLKNSFVFLGEKNPKLVEVYKRRAEEYFDRAEYIKKQAIQPEASKDGGGSASAQAQKPKYEEISLIE
jgi:hypothetical protein